MSSFSHASEFSLTAGDPSNNRLATEAVDGMLESYRTGDAELGEAHVHLPLMEVIEWKGLSNIWHAGIDEFRQTVEAHREEPLSQESISEHIEWLSDLTALVYRRVKTTLPSGRSFDSPALFVVTKDRQGDFKVTFSWWGAFPDWFQG
ncbi:MAG: hypothetical protein P8Z49_00095 [Acidobacteriota bacterium]|jgi:hypothetical protein